VTCEMFKQTLKEVVNGKGAGGLAGPNGMRYVPPQGTLQLGSQADAKRGHSRPTSTGGPISRPNPGYGSGPPPMAYSVSGHRAPNPTYPYAGGPLIADENDRPRGGAAPANSMGPPFYLGGPVMGLSTERGVPMRGGPGVGVENPMAPSPDLGPRQRMEQSWQQPHPEARQQQQQQQRMEPVHVAPRRGEVPQEPFQAAQDLRQRGQPPQDARLRETHDPRVRGEPPPDVRPRDNGVDNRRMRVDAPQPAVIRNEAPPTAGVGMRGQGPQPPVVARADLPLRAPPRENGAQAPRGQGSPQRDARGGASDRGRGRGRGRVAGGGGGRDGGASESRGNGQYPRPSDLPGPGGRGAPPPQNRDFRPADSALRPPAQAAAPLKRDPRLTATEPRDASAGRAPKKAGTEPGPGPTGPGRGRGRGGANGGRVGGAVPRDPRSRGDGGRGGAGSGPNNDDRRRDPRDRGAAGRGGAGNAPNNDRRLVKQEGLLAMPTPPVVRGVTPAFRDMVAAIWDNKGKGLFGKRIDPRVAAVAVSADLRGRFPDWDVREARVEEIIRDLNDEQGEAWKFVQSKRPTDPRRQVRPADARPADAPKRVFTPEQQVCVCP
jgi:hypothetical protein